MSEPREQAAEMSTPETLGGIFFEPGRTFDALRARPRFLVAGLIILVLTLIVSFFLFQKVDFADFMRQQMEQSGRASQMTPEQMGMAMRIGKITAQVMPPVFVVATIAAGAALYLLGVLAMGKKISYKQALAVWVYSEFAPGVLASIVSLLLLFLKPASDIDLTRPGGGLLVTNPSVLLGPQSSHVLVAALGSLDLFKFYGLFLAALGLRKVARLSTGSAWTIVLALWFLGVLFNIIRAAFSGG